MLPSAAAAAPRQDSCSALPAGNAGLLSPSSVAFPAFHRGLRHSGRSRGFGKGSSPAAGHKVSGRRGSGPRAAAGSGGLAFPKSGSFSSCGGIPATPERSTALLEAVFQVERFLALNVPAPGQGHDGTGWEGASSAAAPAAPRQLTPGPCEEQPRVFLGPVQLLELAAQQRQPGTERPRTACSGTGGSGSTSTGGTGTEMGFGPREAPGRCVQHLSKGAAPSPLLSTMGLGGSFWGL